MGSRTPATQVSEELTFVVYHDARSPRSFRMGRITLRRWATILTALLLALGAMSLIGIRGLLRRPDSELQRLTRQNADLEQELTKLRSTPTTTPAEQASVPVAAAPVAPTVKATPQETASPALPVDAPFLFSAFPRQLKKADESKLPFKVENWKITAEKTQISVRFSLLYTLEDGGHQQGRILIVARGPGILLTHPYAAIQNSSAGFLFNPEEGEFFSVGKFREVKAEFPLPDSSILSTRRITEVQALLFSQKGELLFQRTESVEARK